MNRISLLSILFLFTFTQFTFANITTTSDYLYSNSNARNPNGIWLFLGSNIGLVNLKDNTKLPNRNGHQVNFKVLGSFYEDQNKFIYDLGAGFQSNRMTGQNVKFSTQSFFIDVNARYRFTHGWSAGPVANILFGNKNSFTEDKKVLATFIGATAHYEMALDNQWIFRIGGRALTDLDVSSRRVNKFLLDFQIGFPPTNSSSYANNEYVYEDAIQFEDHELIAEPIPDISTTEFNEPALIEPIAKPVVSIKIEDVMYTQGQIQPQSKDNIYLSKLANVLTEHQDLFDQVTVKGHAADFKSTKKLGNTNRIISNSRSKDVLKRLATNGLPSSKIFSMAFGEHNPNTVSDSGRRVELEFTGVKDETKLRELIKAIKE